MNDVKQKAKMLLAGLAAMPALAAAQPAAVQSSGYHAPYNDEEQGDLQDGQLSVVTGLSVAELRQARALVTQLNAQDVVTVQSVNLTKAPVIPYHYNLPAPGDVDAARIQNLDRLAKLRAMIEAAK